MTRLEEARAEYVRLVQLIPTNISHEAFKDAKREAKKQSGLLDIITGGVEL